MNPDKTRHCSSYAWSRMGCRCMLYGLLHKPSSAATWYKALKVTAANGVFDT